MFDQFLREADARSFFEVTLRGLPHSLPADAEIVLQTTSPTCPQVNVHVTVRAK